MQDFGINGLCVVLEVSTDQLTYSFSVPVLHCHRSGKWVQNFSFIANIEAPDTSNRSFPADRKSNKAKAYRGLIK